MFPSWVGVVGQSDAPDNRSFDVPLMGLSVSFDFCVTCSGMFPSWVGVVGQ